MDLAVVEISGKQYPVSVGEKLEVTGHLGRVGEELTFPKVLLKVSGDKVEVGKPSVAKATVMAKVVSSGRGDKVRVAKFKAKSRYRRVTGFRPDVTLLEVTAIK